MVGKDMVEGLLSYDPETGKLYWKVSPKHSHVKAGSEAGSLSSSHGYVQIQIAGRLYQAHRIAHLLMTGHWPERDPEHENRIRSDNRWENIKDLATKSQNQGNKGLNVNNNSGFKGVAWDVQRQKWISYIKISAKNV